MAGGCEDRANRNPYPGVLDPVPDLRGRAACRLDSIATRVTGIPIAYCDMGEGVTLAVHGDTVFSVERKLPLPAPDTGQSLLDYWNRHLREPWERRFGGRPDALNSDGQPATRLEAIWNTSSGVRHLFTLQRPNGALLQLDLLSIDCRETDRAKQAIACW